jgi:hypothetical protein
MPTESRSRVALRCLVAEEEAELERFREPNALELRCR